MHLPPPVYLYKYLKFIHLYINLRITFAWCPFLLPHTQLPVAVQLEQALKTLRQNAHTITDVKQQAKKAEEHADRLEKALNKAQNQLLKRDREIAELHLQIGALGKEQVVSHDEPDRVSLRTAQETAEQLRVGVCKLYDYTL